FGFAVVETHTLECGIGCTRARHHYDRCNFCCGDIQMNRELDLIRDAEVDVRARSRVANVIRGELINARAIRTQHKTPERIRDDFAEDAAIFFQSKSNVLDGLVRTSFKNATNDSLTGDSGRQQGQHEERRQNSHGSYLNISRGKSPRKSL